MRPACHGLVPAREPFGGDTPGCKTFAAITAIPYPPADWHAGDVESRTIFIHRNVLFVVAIASESGVFSWLIGRKLRIPADITLSR